MGAIVYRARIWSRAHRAGVAGTTVVVALVGGLVLALAGGAVRTATASERYVSSRPVAYDVTIEQAGGQPRDDDLAQLPAIERVDLATFVFGLLTPVDGPPVDGLLFSGSPAALGSELVEGRLPEPGVPGEFVATRSFATNADMGVGDEATLVTITQEQSTAPSFDGLEPEGPALPATMVGVLDDGPSGLQEPTPVAIFGRSLLDEGDIGISGSQARAVLSPGATRSDLRAQIDGLDEGDVFGITAPQIVPEEVRVAVEAQAQAVSVLAVVVAVSGLVLLLQLLTRQLRLGDDERSALRAVGLRPAQLVGEPLGRALVPLVVGSAGAAAIAYAASRAFPVGFSRSVDPHRGLRFDLLAHVGGAVALALAALLGVGLLLLRDRAARPARLSPLVDRIARWLPSAPASTAVSFSFGRGPSRGVNGRSLGGVALVFGLLVGAVTVGASLARLLDQPARYGYRYDVGTGAGGGELPDDVIARLDRDPDIEALVLYGASTVAVDDYSLGIVGMLPVRGGELPETLEGRLPQAADELALGRRAARELGVEVGDEVETRGASGPQTFRITGIALVQGVEESDLPGRNGLVTEAGLLRIDPDEHVSTAAIDLVPGAPASAVDDIADRTGVDAEVMSTPSDVRNLDRVRGVPFLVGAIVAGLVLLSVGNLMVTTVRRQRHDLGVL